MGPGVSLAAVPDDGPTLENHDAERAVLGAVLLTRGAALDDIELTAAEMHQPRHEALYALMTRMHEDRDPIEPLTLARRVLDLPPGNPARRGVDAPYLHTLMQACQTPASGPYYARMVREMSTRRRLTAVGTLIAQHAATPTRDPQDAVETARAELDALSATVSGGDVITVTDTLADTLDALERPDARVPTGWTDLDHLIGGWRPGNVYIIGARPGSGKSLIGVQAAAYMAVRHARPVAISSLEMSKPELDQRLLSMLGSADLTRLTNSALDEDTWERVRHASKRLYDAAPITVDDRASVRPGDIRAHARNTARRCGGLGMVVVDYLQLIEGSSGAENRQVEIAQASRAMKVLAKDLAVPVLVLAQLNRGSESRHDKRPRLADLRESGALEQDCDIALMLHRDEENAKDDLYVNVAKNRHGPKGDLTLKWEAQYSRVVTKAWTPSGAI